jgi:hypothetical protein
MLKTIGLVSVAAILGVSPASAWPQAQDTINHFKAGDLTARFYADGVLEGLLRANLRADAPPMYCQPAALDLSVDQAISITEQYIATKGGEGTAPLGVQMLAALKDAFPCRGVK